MEYLVIGLYDDGQRWAESYEAESPAVAEALAEEDYPEITIAGVVALVAGKMEVVR